jgi:predicted Zn-dependent peptidase
MKKFAAAILALSVLMITACNQGKPKQDEFVDPIDAQFHELENGLKVYFSVNKEKPRIQTFIAVNTGSSNDPSDATGLAHYLEHMLFKGTSEFATLDWEKEKVLLDQISDLYEQHRAETDEAKRKEIYAQIDSLSGEAAKYAIPNEYDKMINSLGAQGTNAFTSLEQTMYINDIPSTELEKWMKVEAERFSELVLRLFHTELEAVYEEFNRAQDNDYRKASYAMDQLMYKKHPYGTQTTLGTGEHLKNPSMVKIHEYFNKYYVPNNMAIILAGDFDPDQALEMIKKYFGGMERKDVTQPIHPREDPITEVRDTTVYGPMKEWVNINYRLDGYHSEDAVMLELFSQVLSNGTAGLMDLDLIQKQKVLRANAWGGSLRDYSELSVNGNPKSGQSLEEVRDLLLEQIERVKNGDFSEELLASIIRNNRVERLEEFEYNWLRAYLLADAFILGTDWKEYVTRLDTMATITKEELSAWARENFNDNYCIVYKKTGTNDDVYKVDKPQITPVDINRETQSAFYQEVDSMESIRLKPEFVNFEKDLGQQQLAEGFPLYHVKNETNDLFRLFIELDDDLKNEPMVNVALQYLDYLGTDKYTNEEIKTELYNLGLTLQPNASSWKVYVSLSGIEESFDAGLDLMEHLLRNAKADTAALENLKADILKQREDNKKDKWRIMQGLKDYAKYGPENKFNNLLSKEELMALTAEELIDIIHNLANYKHRILYYGKSSMNDVAAKLKTKHPLPETPLMVENPKKFEELPTEERVVYFADYDMVQTELTMMSKGEKYNPEKAALINAFNQFFGSGLSSLVFQEIREAKALAYSAYAYVSTPSKPDESHYVNAYIGTQNNKLADALEAMQQLMDSIPEGTEAQYEESKLSALKQIESNRVTKDGIYWVYRSYEDKGIDYNLLERIYKQLKEQDMDDIRAFFNEDVANRPYVYCVIGKKADMDMKPLKELGEVKELTLEEIFGY